MSALALCARSNPSFGDRVFIRPDITPEHRPCSECSEDLLVAPSTLAMPGVILACNPCGQALVADRGVKKLGIAPGALNTNTPEDRRRRSTLEAHGFRDVASDET